MLILLAFVLRSQSIGGAVSGSTAFCTANNSGFVSLNGYDGNVLCWQFSNDNGSNWAIINNTNPTQSYVNLSTTTLFRAIVKKSVFPSDTSLPAQILIHPKAIAGSIVGAGQFCSSGTGTLNVTGTQGNIVKWQYSSNSGNSWLDLQTTLPIITYTNITQSIILRVIASNITGCPLDTSAVAQIQIDQPTASGSIFGLDSVCKGLPKVNLTLSGYQGSVLGWKSKKTNETLWTDIQNVTDSLILNNVVQSQQFIVIVKNGVCPTETTTPFILGVYKENPANAGSDITITQHEEVQLKGSGNGFPYWKDETGKFFSNNMNPTIRPEVTTSYTLLLIDNNKCVTTDEVRVNVIIPIPNAFSPNNDGMNDYFLVEKITEFPSSSLKVFNKWGKMVYEASPYLNEFNGMSNKGDLLPDEVYYYVLDYGNGEQPIKNFILIKR